MAAALPTASVASVASSSASGQARAVSVTSTSVAQGRRLLRQDTLTQMEARRGASSVQVPSGWIEHHEPGTGLPYWVHPGSRSVVTDITDFDQKQPSTPRIRRGRSHRIERPSKKPRPSSQDSPPRRVVVCPVAEDNEDDEYLVDLQDSPVEAAAILADLGSDEKDLLDEEDEETDDEDEAGDEAGSVNTSQLIKTQHFGACLTPYQSSPPGSETEREESVNSHHQEDECVDSETDLE